MLVLVEMFKAHLVASSSSRDVQGTFGCDTAQERQPLARSSRDVQGTFGYDTAQA